MTPTPDASFQELLSRLADQQATSKEASIVGQVGLKVRQTVNVRLQKPRWMPTWAYHRLLRTIVIEESRPSYEVTA